MRRSTPNIRNYKRYLTIGRSHSSQTESSGRISSTCSSQLKTSTDCCRLSSQSSYEMESTSASGNNLQQCCESNHTFEPRTPQAPCNLLSPRHISQNTRTYILSPRVVVTPQQKELDGTENSLWVAVEISGKLSQISSTRAPFADEPEANVVPGTYINHKLGV